MRWRQRWRHFAILNEVALISKKEMKRGERKWKDNDESANKEMCVLENGNKLGIKK